MNRKYGLCDKMNIIILILVFIIHHAWLIDGQCQDIISTQSETIDTYTIVPIKPGLAYLDGSYIATVHCSKLQDLIDFIKNESMKIIGIDERSKKRNAKEIQISRLCIYRFDGNIILHDLIKKNMKKLGVISIALEKAVILSPPLVESSRSSHRRLTASSKNKNWGLDRIDQPILPLDSSTFSSKYTGKNVLVYIVDSGINVAHNEFQNRLDTGKVFLSGYANTVNDGCGHGTHCAATAVGQTGVAKGATIVPVRVLKNNGQGTETNIISAIQWIVSSHNTLYNHMKVVSMSLGLPKSYALNLAIEEAASMGIIFVVAAGNQGQDSCDYSPASAGESRRKNKHNFLSGIISVGASNKNDERATFSNYGDCVDIFAPGVSITSAGIYGDDDYYIATGTSQAVPHVTGVIALLLEKHNGNHTNALDELYKASRKNTLKNLKESPNLLLQIPFNERDQATGPPILPTARPTTPTLKPTTVKPTTHKPSSHPTTYSPTAKPSTPLPTTPKPTSKPTTSHPSIAPTTDKPTTSNPTRIPTTSTPTSARPSPFPTKRPTLSNGLSLFFHRSDISTPTDPYHLYINGVRVDLYNLLKSSSASTRETVYGVFGTTVAIVRNDEIVPSWAHTVITNNSRASNSQTIKIFIISNRDLTFLTNSNKLRQGDDLIIK